MALGQLSEFFSQVPNFWGQEKALSLLGSDLSLDWVAGPFHLASKLTPTARIGKAARAELGVLLIAALGHVSPGANYPLASNTCWPVKVPTCHLVQAAALRRKGQKRHSQSVSRTLATWGHTPSFLPLQERKFGAFVFCLAHLILESLGPFASVER